MNRAAPLPFVLAALALALPTPGCKKEEAPKGADPSASAAPGAAGTPAAANPGAGALAGFEGEIEVLLRAAGKTPPEQTLRLHVKGDRLRMDVPRGHESAVQLGGAPRVVFDVKAQKMTAIVDERKMAMIMDVSRFAEQAKAMAGAAPSTPSGGQPKLTRTGRTDTVAGHRCEEWEIAAPTGEISQICVAGGAAPFFAFPAAALPPDHAWTREVFDGRHLPLRFVGKSKAGVEESRVEVRKLEKKTVNDSEFAIPAGYQVMDMAQMTQGLLAGMPSALRPSPAAPSTPQLPPGLQLPQGVQMPQLPQGVQMPPEAAKMLKEMQERAKAAQQPK